MCEPPRAPRSGNGMHYVGGDVLRLGDSPETGQDLESEATCQEIKPANRYNPRIRLAGLFVYGCVRFLRRGSPDR